MRFGSLFSSPTHEDMMATLKAKITAETEREKQLNEELTEVKKLQLARNKNASLRKQINQVKGQL